MMELRRRKRNRFVSALRLICGLGNPGSEYDRTRHNVGFRCVDSLFERHGGRKSWKSKFGAEINELQLAGEKVVLVKPQTYMNLSGGPLKSVMGAVGVGVEEIVVVHDELDLDFGNLMIVKGRGPGGHNGLKSVAQALGTNDYARIRIGIGKPFELETNQANVNRDALISSWVLGRFNAVQENELPGVLDRSCLAIEEIFRSGIEKAQNLFNA